jgi:hypothetical protein
MKFTQNEAAKKISAILTRGGKKCYLSERTINEQVDTLCKLLVNDETELDDFIQKAEPIFKTMNGNVQNDQASFINQWNTDHPAPEPPSGDVKPNATEPAPSKEMQELREKVQQLLDMQAKSNEQRILSEKRNELIAKLKEKGVKDSEWIDSFVGEISISADLDVEKKADDYLKLYNKSVAGGAGQQGPTPMTPGGGNLDDNDSLKLASQMAKQKRESEENRFK